MNIKSKILLGLVAINAIAWSNNASADQYTDAVDSIYKEDPLAAHAVCAAWNVLVATKSEGAVAKLIGNEAMRHYSIVEAKIGEAVAADAMEDLLVQVQTAYNTKEITWLDIVSGAEACGRY